MLSEVGFRTVVKTIYRLCCGRNGVESVNDVRELRRYYLDFLKEIYPGLPVNDTADPFIEDQTTEATLASAFQMHDALGNPDQQLGFIGEAYVASVKGAKIEQARAALGELLSVDNDLRSIFELVVHSVIIRAPKQRGGRISHSSSAATAVGVIWLSYVDGLSKQDLQELFVHELVHQLLFIDDFLHDEFRYDAMSRPENYALTALSLTPRPMDIVIHSLVVAAELVNARSRWIGEPAGPKVHPRTDSIVSTFWQSHGSLTALPSYNELVTPHIASIITKSTARMSRASPRDGGA